MCSLCLMLKISWAHYCKSQLCIRNKILMFRVYIFTPSNKWIEHNYSKNIMMRLHYFFWLQRVVHVCIPHLQLSHTWTWSYGPSLLKMRIRLLYICYSCQLEKRIDENLLQGRVVKSLNTLFRIQNVSMFLLTLLYIQTYMYIAYEYKYICIKNILYAQICFIAIDILATKLRRFDCQSVFSIISIMSSHLFYTSFISCKFAGYEKQCWHIHCWLYTMHLFWFWLWVAFLVLTFLDLDYLEFGGGCHDDDRPKLVSYEQKSSSNPFIMLFGDRKSQI